MEAERPARQRRIVARGAVRSYPQAKLSTTTKFATYDYDDQGVSGQRPFYMQICQEKLTKTSGVEKARPAAETQDSQIGSLPATRQSCIQPLQSAIAMPILHPRNC